MGRPKLEDSEKANSGPLIHERKDCSHGHCGCYYTNSNKCCFCKQTSIEPTWRAVPKVRRAFGERSEAAEALRQKTLAGKTHKNGSVKYGKH